MPTAYNDTLVQTISDHFGSGFNGIFGSVLIVGLFIIIFVLGFLFILGFTPDVAIPVMIILILTMASRLPTADYPVLPGYAAALVGLFAAVLIFFAFTKLIRR